MEVHVHQITTAVYNTVYWNEVHLWYHPFSKPCVDSCLYPVFQSSLHPQVMPLKPMTLHFFCLPKTLQHLIIFFIHKMFCCNDVCYFVIGYRTIICCIYCTCCTLSVTEMCSTLFCNIIYAFFVTFLLLKYRTFLWLIHWFAYWSWNLSCLYPCSHHHLHSGKPTCLHPWLFKPC